VILLPANPRHVKITAIGILDINKQALYLLNIKDIVKNDVTLVMECVDDTGKDVTIKRALAPRQRQCFQVRNSHRKAME
jgi:uncharacterized protein YnzC (UPF0291/DUF896 family)